ncbi:MAG TPA: DUF2127 domain-containing protein [Rudaea sp.]|nr:DUF2127 domain-containing protein [Rudaea sp.]
MPTHSHRALKYIAAFKLVKALGLIIVAVAAFDLVQSRHVVALADWVAQLPFHQGHRFAVDMVDKLLGFGPRKFLAIGTVACIYASVFIVEGWGLWQEKRWAEYLTVIVTASLIPFEVWEIFQHFTWLKIFALVLNVAIVWYLIYVLREK